MLTLPLEPTDDRANPIFKDTASCVQWLGQLQLTNLQLAHSKLLTQIIELNRYPMCGVERFSILELLRETVGYIQDDLAKKLIGKPLPLNENELMLFLSIVQLWQALVVGYQRVLQDYIAGDKQLAKHGALLCQRCLFYSGLKILEYLRTGYKFSPKLWRQLHALYSFAEQRKLHQTEVPDALSTHQMHSNCVNIYVKTLLASYTNPAQLTRWQLQQMDHWLSLWSNSVTVERRYTLSKNDAEPLAADLSDTQGLQRIERVQHNDTMRYLAMVPLSKLLRVHTILLQQGQTPLQLGLGDHFDSRACVELLTFLHQCWCEDKHKRSCVRRPVSLNAALCYKPKGIYAHLTGKPFIQRDRSSLARTETPAGALASTELVEMGYPLENWLMENESIMGARLHRADAIGGRINCKQLIALRPSNAQYFMLGATVWVRLTQNGKLEIGVRYLPGRPEPVRIRAHDINLASLEAPAFLLPAIPSLKTPSSLVIPRDWFQTKRLIEVSHADGKIFIAQLGFSVERGLDYERVSFTTM